VALVPTLYLAGVVPAIFHFFCPSVVANFVTLYTLTLPPKYYNTLSILPSSSSLAQHTLQCVRPWAPTLTARKKRGSQAIPT